MAVKLTIERVLRDDDDESGQSVRDWAIEIEQGILIRSRHGTGFLLMRADDIDIFTADLQRAKALAVEQSDQRKEKP